MTVGELIEKLWAYNQDLDVFIDHVEGTYIPDTRFADGMNVPCVLLTAWDENQVELDEDESGNFENDVEVPQQAVANQVGGDFAEGAEVGDEPNDESEAYISQIIINFK